MVSNGITIRTIITMQNNWRSTVKTLLSIITTIFIVAATVAPANAWYRNGYGPGYRNYRPGYNYQGYNGWNNNWGAAAGIGLGLGLLGGALATQQYQNNYRVCVDPYGTRYYC